MADSDVLSECSSVYLDQNIQENTGNHCKNCDKQKIKCQKTLDELKSAQLIIELLQREANLNNGVCRFCANEESKEKKYINKGNKVCKENSDVNSVLLNLNGNTDDQNSSDIDLDMNELPELHNMAIHPWVLQVLSTVVTKLEKELMIQKYKLQNEVALKPKKSYWGRSEVVTRRVPTIITSKSILEKGTKHNQSTQTLGNNFCYVRKESVVPHFPLPQTLLPHYTTPFRRFPPQLHCINQLLADPVCSQNNFRHSPAAHNYPTPV
jgi:hypothetical protein